MQSVTIVKVGGNVINQQEKLASFLQVFSRISSPKILVHGGGVKANLLLKKLGIEPQMIEGRRITDADTLEVAVMVYAGWINKSIVAQLQASGCNSLGVCGADANLILSEKRPPVPVNFGYVGDIQKVDEKLLVKLLQDQICPVFAPVTHDGKGQLLNTNADSIAAHLAIAIAGQYQTHLCLCFEKKGVLADPKDASTLIETIRLTEIPHLKETGILKDGIIPKVDMAAYAVSHGVKAVHICHFSAIESLPQSINGTRIQT